MPVGLINSSWGGTPAEVIENNSKLARAAQMLPHVEWGPNDPGLLYNAMISPLVPFKLAGVLWYQGESNTANAAYLVFYNTLFRSNLNIRKFFFLLKASSPYKCSQRIYKFLKEVKVLLRTF